MTTEHRAAVLGRLTLAADAIKAAIKEVRAEADADDIELQINEADSHLEEALNALR